MKLPVLQHLSFKPSRMCMDLFITSCTDTNMQMGDICLNISTFFMFTEIQSLLAWLMMHSIYIPDKTCTFYKMFCSCLILSVVYSTQTCVQLATNSHTPVYQTETFTTAVYTSCWSKATGAPCLSGRLVNGYLI